jgi:hypothetical protein
LQSAGAEIINRKDWRREHVEHLTRLEFQPPEQVIMWARLKKHRALLFGPLSGGLILQSSCPLVEDFDPITLFAQAASTIITDSIFFALDSYLVAIS